MPKSVRRKANTGDTQLLPEYLEIPFKVPNGDLRIVLRAVDVPFRGMIHRKTIQRLSQLATEGYKPMFSSFSKDFQDKIVHVYIFFRQSKHLRNPKSGIKNRKGNKVSPANVCSRCGLPTEYLIVMLRLGPPVMATFGPPR
jgi:hypothetical protein